MSHFDPESSEQQPSRIRMLGRRALVVAVVGCVVCGIAAATDMERFMRSYLVAFIFWLGISSGCLAAMMLHRLTGGTWGIALTRVAQRASALIPLMALMFIPIALEVPRLYIWAQPEMVEHDEILQAKEPYLNRDAFTIRAVVYFVIWSTLSMLLRGRRIWKLPGPVSGVGIAAWFLCGTFASVDWMMSLEPHWYSTTYGPMFAVGAGLSGLAFSILAMVWLVDDRPYPRELPFGKLRDLNNLLLAFVMLWAYIAFTQFLIIYYGNAAEDAVWYVKRVDGGWLAIGVAMIALHFFVPFLSLVAGYGKLDPRALGKIAAGLLIIHWFDIDYLIMPAFKPDITFSWQDLLATGTVGAFWLAGWALQPDPYHEDVLQGAEHE
jgi:hypothetical protein